MASRASRLLQLLETLRGHRRPVSAAVLADALQVSPRTLYRDIATLREQGAQIEGEAGLGYLLRPGFTLPPLMFGEEEIEALVLGAQWVAQQADPELAMAARHALDRIRAWPWTPAGCWCRPWPPRRPNPGCPPCAGPSATNGRCRSTTAMPRAR